MARILVVDDEECIRQWLSLELSEQGHEVITTASCHQLMKRVERSKADLIILGIKVIGCDGLEMLHEIRASYADLPVIVWTTCDSYKFENRAIVADYYAIKSCDLTELKSKIERALDAKALFHTAPWDKLHPVGQSTEKTLGTHAFTVEELNRLKEIYKVSERYGVNWVRAVSVFPAETEEERNWKERMLAGIRIVEAMISGHAQTGE